MPLAERSPTEMMPNTSKAERSPTEMMPNTSKADCSYAGVFSRYHVWEVTLLERGEQQQPRHRHAYRV
jgi:hypothetical protein